MLRRLLCSAVLASAMVAGTAPAAVACPSCKNANETDPNRPKAYMYSILFMLSMPAVLFTAFGIGFYRLSRPHANGDVAPL